MYKIVIIDEIITFELFKRRINENSVVYNKY